MTVIRTSPVFDVAISGCGPVGATLAGLLGRAGLSVLVLDKARDIHPHPRAVGFDQDAMRIFQRVGVAGALQAHIAPFRDAVYLGPGGHVIQRVQHVPEPWPLAWRPNYSCDQPGVEAALRDELSRMPNVTLCLGHELTGAVDDAGLVHVQSRATQVHGAPGCPATTTHAARWLVACDGASSPLRRMMGIPLRSLDYDVPWIVVDMLVDSPWIDSLPATNVQYCDPARPCTHVVCPGRHRRWEFMMLDGEHPDEAVSPQRLWQLLAPWLQPGQATIWRAAAYRFHALVAQQWRVGRILLAGDSAHQTPPFMGQGMCQGIRDAGNLAWKLALVLRGDADESLLDTYQAERAPHVEATTALARQLGVLISERDPQRARERDAALLASGGGQAPLVVRQSMIPGLRAGLVATGHALAGEVFPQPWVVDIDASGQSASMGERLPQLLDDVPGEPLHDTPGRGFRVFLDAHAAPAALREAARVASRAGLPVTLVHAASGEGATVVAGQVTTVRETQPVLLPWLHRAGCMGAVVRPDQYVYGAFSDASAAAAVLDRLRQALPDLAIRTRAPHPALAPAA